MPKMSRFNKVPWWMQAFAAGESGQSTLNGAPSLRSARRASKDPKVIQQRLDELFDGSPVVKFYNVHAGVKVLDLLHGAAERGYERQTPEMIGQWSLEVYTLKSEP